MQPPVHLVVGYICYSLYTRWEVGTSPRAVPMLAAIVGAAIPDVLDQPLHAAGVTQVTRTVGHSLLFALPVIAVVWLTARRRGRDLLGNAFAIGYLSHVATDVPWHVLAAQYDELGFLLWPITPMPDYSGVKPLGSVAGVELTTLWLEGVIVVAGVALWWRDGKPGLARVLNGNR